jgi:hypothetical protein
MSANVNLYNQLGGLQLKIDNKDLIFTDIKDEKIIKIDGIIHKDNFEDSFEFILEDYYFDKYSKDKQLSGIVTFELPNKIVIYNKNIVLTDVEFFDDSVPGVIRLRINLEHNKKTLDDINFELLHQFTFFIFFFLI